MNSIWIACKKMINRHRYIKCILVKCYQVCRKLFQIIWVGLYKMYALLPIHKYGVVRRKSARNNGIFSDFLVFLPQLYWADKRGLVPVVDMKNYENPYILETGKVNAWEFFFENCDTKITIDMIENQHISRIYLDRLKVGGWENITYEKVLNNELDEIRKWHQIIEKYIRLKPSLKRRIEDQVHFYFYNGAHKKRILGVKFRGTDYNVIKPTNHYIQPTCERMIDSCKEMLDKEQYDMIFLSTEDAEIMRKFVLAFPGKVIANNIDLLNKEDVVKSGHILMAAALATEKYGTVESGMMYITDIYMLAQCSSLLTSGNSGSVIALIINGGMYENVRFVDLGKY